MAGPPGIPRFLGQRQVRSSQRGKIAYNSTKWDIISVLPGRALPSENGTTAATALLDTNAIRPNYSLSGDYNWVASDKFFLSAKGGYYKQDQYNEGIPNQTRFNFVLSNVGQPASRQSSSTLAVTTTSPTTAA